MADEKPVLTKLFRDYPETPEGKYHVERRDGTTVEWPSFVLGARDEDATESFRFYSLLKMLPPQIRDSLVDEIKARIAYWLDHPHGQNKEYVQSVMRNALIWEAYRKEHGDGDPLMGRHRKDDPATIAKMRKGMSA